MYERIEHHFVRNWVLATAVALVLGIAVLYLPPLLVSRMRLSLYFAPGYLLYHELVGTDFEGGSSLAQYAAILGGTGVAWGSLVAFLWWLKAKFDSLLAYVAFVGFVVAVAVFVSAASKLVPQ